MDEYPIEYLERSGRVDNFAHLIERAESGDVFAITRLGRPIAVVIGVAEYERLRDGTAAVIESAAAVKAARESRPT